MTDEQETRTEETRIAQARHHVMQAIELKGQAKVIQEEQKRHETAIRTLLGDDASVEYADGIKVRVSPDGVSHSLDKAKLEKLFPGAYDKCLKTSKLSGRVTITVPKEDR